VLLFPPVRVSFPLQGLAFQLNGPTVFASPPAPNAFPFPWNSGYQTAYNYSQIVDFSDVTLNSWQENPNPDSVSSAQDCSSASTTLQHLTCLAQSSHHRCFLLLSCYRRL
jgi:hypothetical protein